METSVNVHLNDMIYKHVADREAGNMPDPVSDRTAVHVGVCGLGA